MYDQVSRRRNTRTFGGASGRRSGGQSQEAVRLAQLGICLALFLLIFLGKGAFPQKLGQVREDILNLISTDLDFRGALADLGESLTGSDTVLADFGAFCVEAFGIQKADEAPAEPTVPVPPQPTGVLDSEREFLSQRSAMAVRTAHYADFSRFGLELTPPAGEPETEPPAEAAAEPVTEPEAPPAVPAAGTVVVPSDYSGPELPENYTMDQLSLGELETVTPVLGRLTSGYGYRDHPIDGNNAFHSGVDIGGKAGSPIAAFAAGRVEYTGESDTYGQYLQLDHGNGVKSFYAHCSAVVVVKGQAVAMGDTIARVGSTGVSTGPHLHLELKYEKTRLDPAYYVEFLEE